MSLHEEIDKSLKEALKARDGEKAKVFRLLKSEIKNREVEVLHPLSDEEIHVVISSMIKKRKDSVEQYKAGGREDLANEEEREIRILQKLLPPPLSQDELRSIISGVIQELGASGEEDFGKVMKEVVSRVKGRADGRVVNVLVKELLDQA